MEFGALPHNELFTTGEDHRSKKSLCSASGALLLTLPPQAIRSNKQ